MATTKKKGKGKKSAAGTAAPSKAAAFKVGQRVEVVGKGSWALGAVGAVTACDKGGDLARVAVRLDHKQADSTFPANALKAI